MAADLSRFKVPAGSLLVDGALVFALIYYGGQLTERLEQVNKRVSTIEATTTVQNTSARVLVLERRAEEQAEFKREVYERLVRIEDKLDQIAERQR